MPVPRARQIVLAAAERRRLKQLAYSRTAPYQLVIRVRIVLDAAHGYSNAKISLPYYTSPRDPRGTYRPDHLVSALLPKNREHVLSALDRSDLGARFSEALPGLVAEPGHPAQRRPVLSVGLHIFGRLHGQPGADSSEQGYRRGGHPVDIPRRPVRHLRSLLLVERVLMGEWVPNVREVAFAVGSDGGEVPPCLGEAEVPMARGFVMLGARERNRTRALSLEVTPSARCSPAVRLTCADVTTSPRVTVRAPDRPL